MLSKHTGWTADHCWSLNSLVNIGRQIFPVVFSLVWTSFLPSAIPVMPWYKTFPIHIAYVWNVCFQFVCVKAWWPKAQKAVTPPSDQEDGIVNFSTQFLRNQIPRKHPKVSFPFEMRLDVWLRMDFPFALQSRQQLTVLFFNFQRVELCYWFLM